MRDNGGPAFPSEFSGGMSLRDWFAGNALQGLLAAGRGSGDIVVNGREMPYDEAAYLIADKMLERRLM